jgi:hypothetical protein
MKLSSWSESAELYVAKNSLTTSIGSSAIRASLEQVSGEPCIGPSPTPSTDPSVTAPLCRIPSAGPRKPTAPWCRRVSPCPDAPMDDVKTLRGLWERDSGQTNDGPLVGEGKLLSGHASSRVGKPGPRTGISGKGQSFRRQAYGERGPWSGDLGARQVAVDLAGDIALEHADGFALGATVFDPTFHVGPSPRIRGEPGDHDVPQRPVGLAAPAVQP